MYLNNYFTNAPSLRRDVSWISSLLCLALIFVGMSGCQGKSLQLAVDGTVTLNGQPLEKGEITFRPLPGTPGPTAGAHVIDGKYSILAEKGLMCGKFVVEVSAFRAKATNEKTLNAVTGKMETTEAYESIIPPRYNEESELRAEVTANGPNRFDFALTSK